LAVRDSDGILSLVLDSSEPPLTPAVATSVTCPGCGVAVAVGYPRCPRCHTAVPQAARPKRSSVRDDLMAGGTSVEPPESPRPWGAVAWLAGGAAAIVAVVVLWALLREDATPPGVGRAPTAESDEAEPAAEEVAAPEAPAEGATKPTERPAADPLADAVIALDQALRAQRVWATVRRDGDVVVIESALCGDGAMSTVVAGAGLREAGASLVRCVAPHGAVVWETGL